MIKHWVITGDTHGDLTRIEEFILKFGCTENDIIAITFGERTLKVRVLDVKEHVGKADASSLYEVIEE